MTANNSTTKRAVKIATVKGATIVKQTDPAILNVTANIATLAAKGRMFTDARNALVAHALVTGVKASVIVSESGLDKGDVSRINKVLSTLSARDKGTLKRAAITVDDANVSALAKLGEKFFRRNKVAATSTTGESKTPATRTTIDKDSGVTVNSEASGLQIVTDAAGAILDALAAASEDERAEWFAMVLDILTPENVDRAAAIAAEHLAAA